MPNGQDQLLSAEIKLFASRRISYRHILSALKYLKSHDKLSKFSAEGRGCYELYICSLLLHDLENAPLNSYVLEDIFYISDLLDKIFFLGDFKIQLNVQEDAIRTYSSPKYYNIPNAIKAIFLMLFLHTIVLPKAILKVNNFEKELLNKHKTIFQKYYQYLCLNFIPTLFNILNAISITSETRIIGVLCKILLNFPAEFFFMTHPFINTINIYTLTHITNLANAELFIVLKLNDYSEILQNKSHLDKEHKLQLSRELVKRACSLDNTQVALIMSMQHTLFNECREILEVLYPQFASCFIDAYLYFSHSLERYYSEQIFFTGFIKALPKSHIGSLHRNFICPMTCSLINIAYISNTKHGQYRIAINLDSETPTHKIEIRTRALKNAGWIVVCQSLPKDLESHSQSKSIVIFRQAQELINKLKYYLPLQVSLDILLQDEEIKSRILSFIGTQGSGHASSEIYRAGISQRLPV